MLGTMAIGYLLKSSTTGKTVDRQDNLPSEKALMKLDQETVEWIK